MKELVFLGTSWPIPESWRITAPDTAVGAEGALRLTVADGDLIDPARCGQHAASIGPQGRLLSTLNGVALVREVPGSPANVIDYRVHIDTAAVNSPISVPELSAVYAISDRDPSLMAMVRNALRELPIDQKNTVRLDQAGHLTFGPIPVCSSWIGRQADRSSSTVVMVNVGGGWIDFFSDTRCCGVFLEPLFWRGALPERFLALLYRSVRGGSDSIGMWSDECADVWGYRLSDVGVSYCIEDARERVKYLGAAWRDDFEQAWHLRYVFCGQHPECEQSLRASSRC